MQQNIHCELPELICRQALNFHQNTELSNHINLAKSFYKTLAVHRPGMYPKYWQSWSSCIQIQCTLNLVKLLALFFPTSQFIDERLMKLFYIVFAFWLSLKYNQLFLIYRKKIFERSLNLSMFSHQRLNHRPSTFSPTSVRTHVRT